MSYSIAQAAKITGISAYTLRYYDKEGLMPFVKRSTNGNREFTEEDFEWLSFIVCLKNTGMPIKSIKDYMKLCQAGDSSLQKRLEVFRQQKKVLEKKTAALEDCMKKIDYKIWYYETALEAGTESVHWKNNGMM